MKKKGVEVEGKSLEVVRDPHISSLASYIHEMAKKGYSNNEIKDAALKGKWSKEHIEKAFLLAFNTIKNEIRPEKIDKDHKGHIIAYIGKMLEKGISSDKIRNELLKNGWKAEQISEAFANFKTKKDMPANAVEIDSYEYHYRDLLLKVIIYSVPKEPTSYYRLVLPGISKTTEALLEDLRLELIKEVNISNLEVSDSGQFIADDNFIKTLHKLILRFFPSIEEKTKKILSSYMISRILGMGEIEILRNDSNLEEIVVNNAIDGVWAFHRKHGWLKTNLVLESEEQIRQYSSMIGRLVGREITTLHPILDGHLSSGDRINATLSPVTTKGNTMTIRKFAEDPWTITKFLDNKTISFTSAVIMWTAIQYELSALVVGGTASGKTSTLNVLSSFIPPNQRVVSIEDTNELKLPAYAHWVPMTTIPPNPEGKGEVSMADLLVNALRMRPDRILVGEVRRAREAETLFEAIHTGHSCYATFHANDVEEAVTRLTNPPVNVPKVMIPAISLLIVQYRNRRLGYRRTFQLAETLKDGTASVLYQYNAKKDMLEQKNTSKSLFDTIRLYTGLNDSEIHADLEEKRLILKYLVKKKLADVDSVGQVMSQYYTAKDELLRQVKQS